MKRLLLLLITLYQNTVSVVLPSRCRFYPSCSHYSQDAITQFGVLKGLHLTVKRIIKCHPFHPGGVDVLIKGEQQ